MDNPPFWNGPALSAALTEVPSLTLSFYSFGVMLRRQEGGLITEYPVDPAQIAVALAAKVRFDTGLLAGDILLVRQDGTRRTVVGYRSPSRTGLFLEGREEPLRVPLPPLVMIRTTVGDQAPTTRVFAAKTRPASLDVPLFHTPLPNVFGSGAICWGTVPRADGADLSEEWGRLLGSPFGSHAVTGKSKCQPDDIRSLLLDLAQRSTKAYPKRDLMPVNQTLAQVLGDASP